MIKDTNQHVIGVTSDKFYVFGIDYLLRSRGQDLSDDIHLAVSRAAQFKRFFRREGVAKHGPLDMRPTLGVRMIAIGL
jgi:hypothetical protein